MEKQYNAFADYIITYFGHIQITDLARILHIDINTLANLIAGLEMPNAFLAANMILSLELNYNEQFVLLNAIADTIESDVTTLYNQVVGVISGYSELGEPLIRTILS